MSSPQTGVIEINAAVVSVLGTPRGRWGRAGGSPNKGEAQYRAENYCQPSAAAASAIEKRLPKDKKSVPRAQKQQTSWGAEGRGGKSITRFGCYRKSPADTVCYICKCVCVWVCVCEADEAALAAFCACACACLPALTAFLPRLFALLLCLF